MVNNVGMDFHGSKPGFLTDKKRVEKALLPYLLRVAVGVLLKRGLVIREDILIYLDRATSIPLQGLDSLSVVRLAKRVERVGAKLLRVMTVDNERAVTVAISRFILKLVEEGKIENTGDQAVLVSLLVTAEVEEDPEEWGDLSGVEKTMARLFDEVRGEGLFLE